MSQITIRHLPEPLERKLRDLARQEGRSLSKTAVSLLARVLGVDVQQARQRDLSAFAGSWSQEEAEAFARNTAAFDRIDPEVWRA